MSVERPIAVVTGAAAGIGLSICRALVADGFAVTLSDADEHAGRRAATAVSATFRRCDVRIAAEIDRLFDGLPQLSVLVNNAGLSGKNLPVDQQDPEEWDAMFAVNVKAAFLASRRAVPLLRTAGGGAIINIGSIAEHIHLAGRSPYSASKAALSSLTITLARELGRDSISVNAILPGTTRGDRINGVLERFAHANKISVAEAERQYLERSATGKYVDPDEIGALASFLANRKSPSLTGQLISVCGLYN